MSPAAGKANWNFHAMVRDKLREPVAHALRQAVTTDATVPVSYTHLRAHETGRNLVCRHLLE